MFEIIHPAIDHDGPGGRAMVPHRRGIALLAVLFIIMAITVLSLGFLANSSTELVCGRNTGLRIETDELAASGLEHARGLILNPQDLSTEYWTGGAGLQLDPGSRDAYDVTVTPVTTNPNDHCTYTITSDASQTQGGEKIGRSVLSAQLRLDPAIALWTGAATTLTSGVVSYGDVRCGGNLINYGTINGDVFAGMVTGTGTRTGRSATLAQLSLAWPTLSVSAFTSHYSTDTLSSGTLSAGTYGPNDPARVLYRQGDLAVQSNTTINAMLLVEGNLTITGGNCTITAPKNVPALYVTGDLIVGDVGNLKVSGLVVVGGRLLLGAGVTGADFQGGVFVYGTILQTTADSSASANYAVVYGAPAWQPSGGRIGGALQFDGADDYAQISAAVSLPRDYSLSLWINADATQNASAAIITKCSSSGYTQLALQFHNGTDLAVRNWDGFFTQWCSTGISLNEVKGGWHHVCIVVSNWTHMQAYLGGVPKSAGVLSDGYGSGYLNIGTDRTVSVSSLYKGCLDDIRVFGVDLSPGQVTTLSQGNLTGIPAPIGNWQLNEAGADMKIAADPEMAAIVMWPGGVRTNWSPAAGAFYKQISKLTP